MIFGNSECFLDFERCFNQGCGKALVDVPFNVAVEEPDTGIVRLKTENKVTGWTEDDGVAAHRRGRVRCLGCVGRIECAGIFS